MEEEWTKITPAQSEKLVILYPAAADVLKSFRAGACKIPTNVDSCNPPRF